MMVEAGGGKDPMDRYEYFQGLSLELINEHLLAISGSVADIKRHYTGPIGRFRKKIKSDDLDALVEAFGDLLPMSLNPAVQQEGQEMMRKSIRNFPKPAGESTSGRIASLSQDVLMFAARFENSGIIAIPLGAGR